MIRRPPRSTRKESSAASDVYKRQPLDIHMEMGVAYGVTNAASSIIYAEPSTLHQRISDLEGGESIEWNIGEDDSGEVYWENYEDCEWDGHEYRCTIDYDDDGNVDWYEYSSYCCLLYTSPSPRDAHESRMPSSA